LFNAFCGVGEGRCADISEDEGGKREIVRGRLYRREWKKASRSMAR